MASSRGGRGGSGSDWLTWRNATRARSWRSWVEAALRASASTDAATTAIRLVIELDDKSHRRPEARERDAFKDAALDAANVPVLRVAVTRSYHVAQLREGIVAAIKLG